MKKIMKNLLLLMIVLIVQLCTSPNFGEMKSQDNDFQILEKVQNPTSADVSGNELYAEQIQATIAANQSLIRQSYITNDTNVFSRMDMADPAFDGSAFYISTSNGNPSIFSPLPVSDVQVTQFSDPNYSLKGFIYYDNSTDLKTVQVKYSRALSILKEAFQIDFITLEPTESAEDGYYYPFFGYYPKWDRYFETVLGNLPMDGYWAAFDQERILSTNYQNSHHFSTSTLYLKNFEYLTNNFGGMASTEIDTIFDLSMINSLSGLTGVFDQLNESGILNAFGGGEAEGEDSAIDLGAIDIEQMLDDFYKGLTNVVLTQVQYEALPSAITPTNGTHNYFDFDLFQALGYQGDTLAASRKAFNSLLGAFLCGITMSLISAEAISTNPDHLFLDDYNIERIQTILFLTGNSMDISALKDYSFKIGWSSQEFLSNLVIIPENLQNQSDPINFLQVLGFFGLPMILGGIINPLENFIVTYKLLNDEPSIRLTRTLTNASQVLFENPLMTIRAENVGSQTVWGQTLNLSTFGIYNDPTYYFGENSPLILAMEGLGYDLEELFHDDNPRVFMFDTYGTGLYDFIYPGLNLLDFDLFSSSAAIAPYSQEFTDALIADSAALGAFIPGGQLSVIALAYTFNSSTSVFNPTNWKIEPGDFIEYTIENLNTTIPDTYTSFYSMSVAQIAGVSPILSYGTVNVGSTLEGATNYNDSSSWDLSSSLIGNQNILQQYLTFQNESIIDFQNNNTDAINLQLVYNTETMVSMNIEIYDYVLGDFISVESENGILGNYIANITIPNHIFDIENYYDNENNNAILLRITYTNETDAFSIGIDFIQTEFQDRDTNEMNMLPARMLFNTNTGNNQYYATSNTIIASTDDISTLTAFTTIDSIVSFSGELNTYNMTIFNIGNTPAYNISVLLEQPGIIENIENVQISYPNGIRTVNATAGNFTLMNGNLLFTIDVLYPGESLQNLSFDFYTPNSRRSPSALVQWEDTLEINPQGFDYFGLSNQIYISAPIKYNSTTNTPYYHHVLIQYTSDFTFGSAPQIEDSFEVGFRVQNIGSHVIYDLQIGIPKGVNGLLSTDLNDSIVIEQINPYDPIFGTDTVIGTFNFTKQTYQGYLLPSLMISGGLERILINEHHSDPIILGTIELGLTKTIDVLDAEEGTIFKIKIKFTNLGNVEMGNFSVSDLESYDAAGFRIVEGQLVQFVDILKPRESIEFEYQLVVIQKGTYIMRGVSCEYFFIWKTISITEDVEFKAREPYWILTARLYLPILLGFGLIYFTFRVKTKYNREDAEFERRETLLFGASLRDTAWHKKNLIEFMDEITNPTENDAMTGSDKPNA